MYRKKMFRVLILKHAMIVMNELQVKPTLSAKATAVLTELAQTRIALFLLL